MIGPPSTRSMNRGSRTRRSRRSSAIARARPRARPTIAPIRVFWTGFGEDASAGGSARSIWTHQARAVRRRELEVLKLGLQRLALAAGELGFAQPGEPLLDRLRFALEPLAVVLLAEVDELLRVDVRDLRGLLRARRNDGHRREVRLGLRDHVHLGVQVTAKSCLHSIREGRELQEPNVGRGLALGLGGSEHRAGVAEEERGLRPVLLVLKKRERERGGLNEHQRQQDREPAPTQESAHAGGLRDLCHHRASPRGPRSRHRSLPHPSNHAREGKLTS